LELISIGITTKNRWKDLENTLGRVAAFGLGETRIIIYDDGSDRPCPFDVASICPRAELKRYATSAGLIVRRNQLAMAMNSRYYLSLDDDSFPVSGSLDAAIEFAESRSDIFCLGFPIYNPNLGKHQLRSLRDAPYKVRSFVGCAHLLHRQRFLALNGYREELIHFSEEQEIAARAFQRGWQCYHFPGLTFYHLASNAYRDWYRMDFYGARNTILWNDWYVPSRVKLARQARSLAYRAVLIGRTRRFLGHARGYLAGVRDAIRYRDKRQPMSPEMYQRWMSMPVF